MKYVFFFLFLLQLVGVKADTWDEPWQKEIIEQSDYFVLGKVIKSSDESVKIHVLHNFGYPQLDVNIEIDDFFLLKLTSSSGQPKKFQLKNNEMYYFFLKKNEKGNYSLPTPTSGFAHLDEDQMVSATYSHSYHKAVLPQEIYEFTYTNIWNFYKYDRFDKRQINDFVDYYLSQTPAGFEDDEIEIFNHQYAAMQTAYLLGLSPKLELVEKFVVCENFYSRVSGLQLLSNYTSKGAKNILYESLLNDELYTNFEKVIAIWSLKKIGDKNYIQRVVELKDQLSNETTGFGGNAMDPRVGTLFPSPMEAAEKIYL